MQYYFAPMEGLTDSIYRQLHHRYFPGLDRYYTPFFSPTVHRCLTPKERRELPPADTLSYQVVPQILTKNAEDFLWLAQMCQHHGYTQVDLNLGCPSGTVTAKGKGAGMLLDPEGLDRFLDAVFAKTPLPVSVKTRLGFTSSDEFPRLLEIFNRYPICQLTIHPRVRSAFYQGAVDMEAFGYAAKNSRASLCYNGDLTCRADIRAIQAQFPQVEAVMLGRGLIGDPGMLCEQTVDTRVLEEFCDALLEGYTQAFSSARNAMFRLKENWFYLIKGFTGGEKLYKALCKTTDVAQYKAITHEIFSTLPRI